MKLLTVLGRTALESRNGRLYLDAVDLGTLRKGAIVYASRDGLFVDGERRASLPARGARRDG